MNNASRASEPLGTEQLRLIESARSFLSARALRGKDVAVDPECYLTGWSRVRGNARLRRLAGQTGAWVEAFIAWLRETVSIARQSGCEVVGGPVPVGVFDKLVVSWSRSSDFADDGRYTDRYFQTSSRDTPQTLWFLIAIDQSRPQHFDSNVRVFCRGASVARFDILHLLRSLVAMCGSWISTWLGARASAAPVSLAQRIAAAVVAVLDSGPFKCVVLPYEAQPFQHAVFSAAERRDRNVGTVGYLHSALPPLPTDLIYRAGAPRILLVHGRGQAEILTRHLSWPRSAVRTIPSLRYREASSPSLGGFIFLPFSFSDPITIESAFRDFLAAAEPATLPGLVVRNHPIMQDSPRHRRLHLRLEEVMRAHADRFTSAPGTKTISVFVGATAAIVEALERGVTVIHICSRPLFEAHSTEVWKDLEVERLGRHLFRYQLPVRGVYIEFGGAENVFERCIDQQFAGPPGLRESR